MLPRVRDLRLAIFRSSQRGYHAHLLTEAEEWEDHALRVRQREPEVGAVQDLIDCAEYDADNLEEDVKSKREHRARERKSRDLGTQNASRTDDTSERACSRTSFPRLSSSIMPTHTDF